MTPSLGNSGRLRPCSPSRRSVQATPFRPHGPSVCEKARKNEGLSDQRSLTVLLLLVASMLGIFFAIAERLIFAAALDRSVDLSEADVLVMNAALAAIPFLYLAFKPKLLLWLIALSATAAAHGWWLVEGITYQMARNGGGVPIFGAVLMLISPFAILLLTMALNGAMSQRRNGS